MNKPSILAPGPFSASRLPGLALVLTLLLSAPKRVAAQAPAVRFLIDTAITLMKRNAVNRNRVHWDTLQQNAVAKAAGMSSPYQLGPVMRYLYEAIDDFHGAFFYKDSAFQWHHDIPISDSIMNEWKKGSGIKTMVLDDTIGYLRIPSMPVASKEDFNRKAQRLNDSLCSLLVRNIKGIILDLRLDGGGAMQPMILGVEQLLQPGNIGSFVTQKREPWILKDNSLFVDTALLARIYPTCSVNAQDIPVVMLISPVTGSAAECLVIAFAGRKKTVLLGSETAGYVTVNSGFRIDDTAFMNLAIGYSADRAGNLYTAAIKPDIPWTSPDKFNDLLNDQKVKAAAHWLTTQEIYHSPGGTYTDWYFPPQEKYLSLEWTFVPVVDPPASLAKEGLLHYYAYNFALLHATSAVGGGLRRFSEQWTFQRCAGGQGH